MRSSTVLVLCALASQAVGFALRSNRNDNGLSPDEDADHCSINRHPDTSDIALTAYVQHVRSIKLPSGTTYRYVFIRPKSEHKSYILFLHGFPSSSFDWRHQIEHFSSKGYGIIAPDLLGYGGTDKPADLSAYRFKLMADDIVSLLDCEDVDSVFGVGHDFGSPFLSRLANYHPSRFHSFSFIDVGYFVPPTALTFSDVEAINNATLASLGYSIFGYWIFFGTSEAASIMNRHLDSVWSLTYTNNETLWETDFGPVGAFENFILEGKLAPWGGWVTVKDEMIHNTIISKNGGYGPPLNWYKSLLQGVNAVDEMSISDASKIISKPLLLITASKDVVVLADSMIAQTKPYATNFRTVSIHAGHFVQIEARKATNEALEEFFEENMEGSM